MIEVERLCKVYGNRVAVWKVSFRVARGEILGFLGPNGAGKTTTMRMITGFIPPSAGTAKVEGFDVGRQPLEVKSRIGYLCETPPLYREMSVRGYLRFVAEIKRVPRSHRKRSLERALELCGLTDVAGRVVGHLSKGYRQRVGLAQAILHEPSVLILDEPTVGLDPGQKIEIRRLIHELAGEQTVVLSTHILPDVTMMCTRVVIINEGQVVAEDSIENLTSGLGALESVRVRVARDSDTVREALARQEGVDRVDREEDGVYEVRVRRDGDARERVAEAIVGAGAGLVELTARRASLEEVFLQLVTEEGSGEDAAA